MPLWQALFVGPLLCVLGRLARHREAGIARPGGARVIGESDPDAKWRRMLRHFVDGARLTRFDAERLGDHALNSTVANLEAMGITFSREPEKLQGRFGEIRCKRYWLSSEQRLAALKLLGEQA